MGGVKWDDPSTHPLNKAIGNLFGTGAAREAAEEQEAAAIRASNLHQEHANRLWEDTKGLRSLRNQSLGVLRAGLGGDRSGFYASPEYRQVKGAGVGVLAPSAVNAGIGRNRLGRMAGRAGESALGEYGNYYNRIGRTAGVTSSGLNQTNAQMQQATDAQTALLSDAAAAGASGLMGASNSAKSTAMGIGGIITSIFSDRRLKENIVHIGKRGDYHYYVWDWRPEAKAIVGDQPAIGVIAQDIQKIRPDAVTEHPSGYLTVDYGRLT